MAIEKEEFKEKAKRKRAICSEAWPEELRKQHPVAKVHELLESKGDEISIDDISYKIVEPESINEVK